MACNFSKKYLEDKGVEFKEINVFEDAEALAMLRDKGYVQMPVVSIEGEFHTGFRPDVLSKVKWCGNEINTPEWVEAVLNDVR